MLSQKMLTEHDTWLLEWVSSFSISFQRPKTLFRLLTASRLLLLLDSSTVSRNWQLVQRQSGVGTLPCQTCQAGKFLASLARQACLACLANEILLASFWQVSEISLHFRQILLKNGSRTRFLINFVVFNHFIPENSRISTIKIFFFLVLFKRLFTDIKWFRFKWVFYQRETNLFDSGY